VLRESTKGPQRHPNDPIDTPGLQHAVVASVADITIDLVSVDDDDDKQEEEEEEDGSLSVGSGSDLDDDDQ
jgi:hypothetical protein